MASCCLLTAKCPFRRHLHLYTEHALCTPNTHGPDSFTYTWSDGMASSDVGTISIDVGTYAEDELCALMIETDGETRVPYCNADDGVVHWTRHDMLHIQLSRPIDQDVIVELWLGVMGDNGEPAVQESSRLFLQVGETRGKYLTIPITTDASGHLVSVCVDHETGVSVELGQTYISAHILAAGGTWVPLRPVVTLALVPRVVSTYRNKDFLRDLGISELIHNCERQHPIALEMRHDFQHALGEYLKDVKVGEMSLRISVLIPEKSLSKQQNLIGSGGTRK
jgi:hypothetical protein